MFLPQAGVIRKPTPLSCVVSAKTGSEKIYDALCLSRNFLAVASSVRFQGGGAGGQRAARRRATHSLYRGFGQNKHQIRQSVGTFGRKYGRNIAAVLGALCCLGFAGGCFGAAAVGGGT